MKVVLVAGARPNFIKIAPIIHGSTIGLSFLLPNRDLSAS